MVFFSDLNGVAEYLSNFVTTKGAGGLGEGGGHCAHGNFQQIFFTLPFIEWSHQ